MEINWSEPIIAVSEKNPGIDYRRATRLSTYGVAINSKNRVGILKTDTSEYILPGGGVESSDLTFEDALHREVLEEIGYEIQIKSLICNTADYYFSVNEKRDKVGYARHFLIDLVKLVSEEWEKDKKLVWLTLEECRQLVRRKDHLQAIEMACL